MNREPHSCRAAGSSLHTTNRCGTAIAELDAQIDELADAMAEGSLVVHDKDPARHKSDTVDIEIVISGKVDIVLESGETRTLVLGSCLIMGGVLHRPIESTAMGGHLGLRTATHGLTAQRRFPHPRSAARRYRRRR